MPLASGTKLGPYEIESALGAGGMGEVYRARDTRLERTVAIKILPAHLSSNAELKARFEREARAVSALNHPHICHLYDIGTQDGTAFLVMEYLDGETLADRLRQGAMPLKQALQFGIQISEALAAAHRAGILHRDLKPGNVMLTATGAKLLDFGLAKTTPTLGGTVAAVSGMTPSTPTMTIVELSSPAKPLTREGTVVGTFHYMAPEVLQGVEADARSDVFSLGCVLYEMVTGRRAFEGKSQLSVLTGILEKDPEPVSQVQPTSPPALDYVVRSCLEKNPEERFQTAHDVKLQLKWIAAGATQAGVPAPVQRRLWLSWLVAGVTVLGAVVATAEYLKLASRPSPVVRSSILPPAGSSFVSLSPESGPAVISPDGTRLAFTARDDKGKTLLYVRALNSVSPQALPGTDEAMYPFWSADGREIGFFMQGQMRKIHTGGGPAQTICEASNGRGGTWNKDGVILFAASVTGPLFRVPAAGGTPEPASRLDAARAENSHRWPYFLPDNQHFLFWGRSALGTGESALYVGQLGSLQPKMIMKTGTAAIYASGYLLFTGDQTLLAQSFDAGRLELTGEAIPVAEHIAVNGATNAPEFSASETGTLVYQTGATGGVWDLLLFTREGKPAGAVAEQDRYYYPALSPDEDRLAVSLFNGTQGTANIWILDLKRGTKSRLTFDAGMQLQALWSRDGRTLYYVADTKGARHIYARAADGSGTEQTILETPGAVETLPSLSPDGHYLACARLLLGGGPRSIWGLPLFGDRKPFPIVQTSFDSRNPAVSPAGKWMAYESNESGWAQIYLTAFPGGGAKWQVSIKGGVDPRWRGDGRELFFLDPSDNLVAVDVDTSSGVPRLGVPHVLMQAVGVQRQVGSYVVTADGKKFLINSGSSKQGSEPLTLVTNWTAELKK
jgi:eukaryotic-like serine/threonine-protein kinase